MHVHHVFDSSRSVPGSAVWQERCQRRIEREGVREDSNPISPGPKVRGKRGSRIATARAEDTHYHSSTPPSRPTSLVSIGIARTLAFPPRRLPLVAAPRELVLIATAGRTIASGGSSLTSYLDTSKRLYVTRGTPSEAAYHRSRPEILLCTLLVEI